MVAVQIVNKIKEIGVIRIFFEYSEQILYSVIQNIGVFDQVRIIVYQLIDTLTTTECLISDSFYAVRQRDISQIAAAEKRAQIYLFQLSGQFYFC